MISAPTPGTFVHVAHVGYDERGRLETSAAVNSEWTVILQELQGYELRKSVIDGARECDFASECLAGVDAAGRSPVEEQAPRLPYAVPSAEPALSSRTASTRPRHPSARQQSTF